MRFGLQERASVLGSYNGYACERQLTPPCGACCVEILKEVEGVVEDDQVGLSENLFLLCAMGAGSATVGKSSFMRDHDFGNYGSIPWGKMVVRTDIVTIT